MSKSAMTPSFSGRTASMWPGVRPSMRLASVPTASSRPSRVFIATMDGSSRTIPRPHTYTSVFAVPRSTAMSRPTTEESQGSGTVEGVSRCGWGQRQGSRTTRALQPRVAGRADASLSGREAGEEQADLALRRLGTVGAVHQVLLGLERQVATDGARGRLTGIRGTHEVA